MSVTESLLCLFDFKFNRLITPDFIKSIYTALFFISSLSAIGAIIFFISKSMYLNLAFSTCLYFVFIISLRIYCEFLLIAFKIESNTRPNHNQNSHL